MREPNDGQFEGDEPEAAGSARSARSRPRVRPAAPNMYAAVPARKTKVGAQKCVIQRVKKSAGVVVAMSVGRVEKLPKKSRVWSSAGSDHHDDPAQEVHGFVNLAAGGHGSRCTEP